MDITVSELIAARIKHFLEIYPVMSLTMMQGALGPTVPAADWRPVLDEMLEHKIVLQDAINLKNPNGRHYTHNRLFLQKNEDMVNSITPL